MILVETRSAGGTQKVARLLTQELRPSGKGAAVLALVGELGAGKTTFVQGFARALGIKEKVLSPTFVLMKVYPLKRSRFRHLIHIDCYRIRKAREMSQLGLSGLLRNRGVVILIEWADRIKKLVPPDALWIRFRHGPHPNGRIIQFL